MAVTPVLIDGSGSGAQSGEWSEGNGLPSLMASGRTPPNQKRQIGIFSLVRPYSQKSSAPITGGRWTTFVSPSHAWNAVASRWVNWGSLNVAGVDASANLTSG